MANDNHLFSVPCYNGTMLKQDYLIRTAMLAFYKDPEKWVTGSYIKIGYFGDSDADLKYQDKIHGSLIEQDVVKAIIAFCSEPKSAKEIVEKFAFPNRLYLKRHCVLCNAV